MTCAVDEAESKIPSASRTFVTNFGELVCDVFFSPLRKTIFTAQGVKRWYGPHLVARPNDGVGFAAINQSDETASHEHIPIPPRQLVLVAHSFETMAARIHVNLPGTYFVVALFTPVIFEGTYNVNIGANGQRLWSSMVLNEECKLAHAQFIRMSSSGFIDFAINSDRDMSPLHSRAFRTFIQYAVVRCDDLSGALQFRYDDRGSDVPEAHLAAIHAQTSFQVVEVPAPYIELEERAALFEREWTLHPEYIQSQYQCSPKNLVERVLNNQGPASLKYCIFMIPRSGSTLLTELLSSTGELGFPGESFVPDVIRTMSLTFSDRFSSYEEFLMTGLRTANGVFGIEVEHERFQQELGFFSDLPSWRHIYIWRKDLLAQAISYQISIDTNVWHTFAASVYEDDLRFISRSAIIEQINTLLRAERFFDQFFTANSMTPYSICFEDLIADKEGQARKIAEYIGISPAGLTFVNEQALQVQPTSRSRNAFYKQQVICSSGQLGGYDIHQHGNRWISVLHGVDLGLLDLDSEREPVLLIADDRQSLCDRVNEFVVRTIASTPTAMSSK